MILAEKRIGETPLECLERVRAEQTALGHAGYADAPMTYAGRLDPLASGLLPILVGEECKEKSRYIGLDKEYEVEVLFGVETDTGDLLGLTEIGHDSVVARAPKLIDFGGYVGRFSQEYPAYSSKTVGGVQLHELARAGELPAAMPTKEVEIYSIENLGEREVSAADILARAEERIDLVHGDFRQGDVLEKWRAFASARASKPTGHESGFKVWRLRVYCSSGTYMRSLAQRLGRDAGTGALAFDIRRTKIYLGSKPGAV